MSMAEEPMDSESGTSEDRARLLKNADDFLSRGLALKEWFDRAEKGPDYREFELVKTLNRPDSSSGFFGVAELEGNDYPVMGVIDEVFYDRPKSPSASREESAAWMRDQMREFVLRYFLRISDYRRPQLVPDPPTPGVLSDLMAPFDWRVKEEVERDGMGFFQEYFRRRDEEPQRFEKSDETRIQDMRKLGSVYDWLLLRLDVYQFNLSLKLMGNSSPQFSVPLKEGSYLIVTPDFICDRSDPEPGVVGEYGLGYAFMKNPERGPFAYGPGEFEAAFQTIRFRVLEDGRTMVRMVFVSNQPEKVVNFSMDPVDWGFALADMMTLGQASRVFSPVRNLLEQMPFRDLNMDPTVPALEWMNRLTMGQAADRLGMSKEALYKSFLRRHSLQHYQTVLGSLRTWRQIPDWLAAETLPEWVREGRSS